MKKKVFIVLFLVCMLFQTVCIERESIAAKAYTYNAGKALEFAKKYWNKNSEWWCARFVYNCLKAGGLDVGSTGSCGTLYNNLKKKTGITPMTLVLTSSGYVSQSANEAILSAGDVVFQYCSCGAIPHVLICGGFKDGVATFYAHNDPYDNKAYKFSVQPYHKGNGHKLGAKVFHFGNVDPVELIMFKPEEYRIYVCQQDNLAIRNTPYSGASHSNSNIKKGASVTIIGQAIDYTETKWFAIEYSGKTVWVWGPNLKGDPNKCLHYFNDRGYCIDCGREVQLNIKMYENGQYRTFKSLKDNIAVRARPFSGQEYTSSTIKKGASITIIGEAIDHLDNQWYATNYNGKVVWIWGGNLKNLADCLHEFNDSGICVYCKAEVSIEIAMFDSGDIRAFTSLKDNLPIRTKPFPGQAYTNSTIKKGASITIIGEAIDHLDNQWYAANYNGKVVWVWGPNIVDPMICTHVFCDAGYCNKCREEFEYEAIVYDNGETRVFTSLKDNLPTRTRPFPGQAYTNSTIKKGASVTVVGEAKDHLGVQWYAINYNGKVVWIWGPNLK